MTHRVLAFLKLDVGGMWKRPLPVIMMLLLGLLTIGLLGGGVQVSAGSTDVGGDKLAINGGFNIAFFDVVVSSIVVPFFAAVICGMPLLVDADRRIRPLLLATPLRHGEYACGRFVASMGVLAFVIAGWQLMQVVAFESWPLDPSRTVRTAFSLGNYLTPVLLFVVPLAIFTGGASMWAGVLTRQPVLVFALPVVIFLGGAFFVWDFNPEWLPRWVDRLLQAVDPAGMRWFTREFLSEDRGVVFYNAARLVPDPLFISSRFGIAGLGLLGVWQSGRLLERQERLDRRLAAVDGLLTPSAGSIEPAAVAARRGLPDMASSPPGLLATLLFTLRRETAALVKSPGVWLFGPLILLETWGVTLLRPGYLDTQQLMTGGSGAASVFVVVSMLLVLLTLFYTVESLVREQRCGLDAIARAAPASTAGMLAGKALANAALAMVIVACAAVAILLAIVVQRVQTGIAIPLDLPAVLLILGVLIAPTIIVWTSFVTLLMAVFGNRFLVYGAALAALIATGLANSSGWLNWLTSWYLGGQAIVWSELDRLDSMWPAIVANRLVMLCLSVCLIAITLAIWPRRSPDIRAIADRFRPAAFWRAVRVPLVASIPLLGLGIWTGQMVRAGYEGKPQRNAAKAYWKRNSATWDGSPAAALDGVDAEVRLFPERRGLEVRGTFVLRNPHSEPMSELPLTVGRHLKASSWTVDGDPVEPTDGDAPPPAIENRSGLFVVRPRAALKTGDTVRVGFELTGSFPSGWSKLSGGMSEFVLPAGVVLTSFSPSFLPVPGFVDSIGVDDKNARDAKEYPPDHWRQQVDPLFGPAWSSDVRLTIEGPASWVLNGCGVEESSELLADGRKRVVWQTEHPVRFFNIIGGPLEAAPGRQTTIYFDPRTPHNVPTMVRSLDAARTRYGEWFAAYPWTNLRVTEFPGLAGYAQGFPGNISFAESIGFLAAPVDDDTASDTFDSAFYIVAHEAAHQWWGNIVTPGKGPGGNVVSEGLAEFSACMLMHHELSPDQAKVLRRRWEWTYVNGREPDNERPINRIDGSRPGDTVVTYQRAGIVFWMLRGLMGEDAMLTGLRDFVDTWRNGVETPEGLDFPLIEDLLESLRRHAPDQGAFDRFTNEWMLERALPSLELRDADVQPDGGGYRVNATLANTGTGTANVTVRVEGKKPADDQPPASADVVIVISDNSARPIDLRVSFEPVRLLVDPDVELLHAGRRRTETPLTP